MSTSKLLTDAACRKYTPGRERRRIRDLGSRSLYLIIEPSGFKAFEMRFRGPTGRIGKVRLGPFDMNGRETTEKPAVGAPLSLQAARTLAAEVLRQKAAGRDAIADIKAKRLHQRVELEQKNANSFATCAADYVVEHCRVRTRRWKETAGVLGLRFSDDKTELEVVPGSLCDRWRNKPVVDITELDLFNAVDEARKSGIPGRPVRNSGPSDSRAHSMHATLRSMFGWLRKRRRIAVDPSTDLHPPEATEARDRVLSDSELRWLWVALDAEPILGPVIKLLTFTGARRREASDCRWSELSDDGTTWTIPKERTKNKKAHVVPLSRAAQALLASVPRVAGSDFVFSRNGKTPPAGWSQVKDRIDEAMKKAAGKAIPHWVVHDVRRTVVTRLAELKVPVDVIELCVGHTSGSRAGIVGIYNRSELLDERRDAFERWSRHLAGIVSNKAANVVSIRRGRNAARKLRHD